jgi:hypothetical protein
VLYAILAAVVAAACVAAPARKAFELSRSERPKAAEVLARIRASQSGDSAADWLWELDELVIEVDGKTRAPAELSTALSRAALACGTAFAVLTLASSPDLAHLPEAGMAFGAGVVGATLAKYFGRMAKAHSATLRSHWSGVARDVRASLERRLPLEPTGR